MLFRVKIFPWSDRDRTRSPVINFPEQAKLAVHPGNFDACLHSSWTLHASFVWVLRAAARGKAIEPVQVVQIPLSRDAIVLFMSNAILKTENLRVDFQNRELGQEVKQALKGLNLAVHPGEVFGFLGPNGAGKTTTMNVLLGFVNATAGDAWLFGVNVREPIARQRIGYLPELTYYYKFLTAEELLRYYARIFQIPKAEMDKRIDAVLKLVELETARKRQIKTFSKGMQQRVGLAQALINDPDLLILDEPTSGLDPVGRMKVREIIQRLKHEGKT